MLKGPIACCKLQGRWLQTLIHLLENRQSPRPESWMLQNFHSFIRNFTEKKTFRIFSLHVSLQQKNGIYILLFKDSLRVIEAIVLPINGHILVTLSRIKQLSSLAKLEIKFYDYLKECNHYKKTMNWLCPTLMIFEIIFFYRVHICIQMKFIFV